MASDIPPKPRRLTLVPSDEDMTKSEPPRTAKSSITDFRTHDDPNNARRNENAAPSGTKKDEGHADPNVSEGHKQETSYPPYATVTTLPTTSTEPVTTRPTTSTTPLSTRRKESFYSCRDTSTPAPPHGADDEERDESVYTQDAEERKAMTPPPLNVREKRRSLLPGEVLAPSESSRERGDKSIFGHPDGHPVTPADILGHPVDSSVHPAYREGTSNNVPGRTNSIARGYQNLISDETMEQREAPNTGEALADAAAAALEDSRRRNEEEIERQMREKRQEKISDNSTATALSSSSRAPGGIDSEKKVESESHLQTTVTVLEEKSDGTSAPPEAEIKYKTFRTFFMGVIVSMGGLIFGYGGIGQVGGFLKMPDYIQRFGNEIELDGEQKLGGIRTGTIVGLLMIGALIGALTAAPITDRFGRKWCIALWAGVFIIGQVIEIATQKAWYQLVIGRIIEGLGIGGLSILTPLYMGETAPKQIRGVMIRYVERGLQSANRQAN